MLGLSPRSSCISLSPQKSIVSFSFSAHFVIASCLLCATPLARTPIDVGVRSWAVAGAWWGEAAATSGANVNKSESHDLLIGGRCLLS